MPPNGQPLKRVKAITIYVVEHVDGEKGVEIECVANKAFAIECLCDALKIAANLEFKKPLVQEPGSFMKLFKR